MLLRVYARCVAGLEDVWISRMEAALRPGDADQAHGRRAEPDSGIRAASETAGDDREERG
jgi:hypothetical protein